MRLLLCLLERRLEAGLLLHARVGHGLCTLMDGRYGLTVRALCRFGHIVKSGCDDHNTKFVVQFLVDGGTENDVCFGVCRRLYHTGSRLDFFQTDIRRTADGQDNPARVVDRGFKQRARNRHLCRFGRLVLTGCGTGADVCKASILHHRSHISKVQIDKARHGNQLGDIGNRLTQNVICDSKRIFKGNLLFGNELQALVGDNNERVHIFAHVFNAIQRLFQTLFALERKRTGHNTDGQHTHRTGDFGNDWCGTGAGTAAHASGDKYHVRAFECRSNFVLALLGCFLAAQRVGASALSLGDFLTNLNLGRCARILQRLLVCIDGDKLYALDTT